MARLNNKPILPLHHNKEGGAPSEHNGAHHGHHPHRSKPTPSPFTSKSRNELVAAAAEFAGTFMFLFFAFGGTQVANTAAIASDRATAGQQGNSITQAPNTSVLLFIALSFGFSLMVNVWVFFRVSGGLFNPAVSGFQVHPSLNSADQISRGRLLWASTS
jgi:aquaporin related protein